MTEVDHKGDDNLSLQKTGVFVNELTCDLTRNRVCEKTGKCFGKCIGCDLAIKFIRDNVYDQFEGGREYTIFKMGDAEIFVMIPYKPDVNSDEKTLFFVDVCKGKAIVIQNYKS